MSKDEREEELRLYAIVRADLLPIFANEAGKLVAQAGHAYLDTALDALDRFPDKMAQYLATPRAKIALKGRNEQELIDLFKMYRPTHGAALIRDAGHTVFDGPTITMIGIGPIRRSELPKRLQALQRFPATALPDAS